MIFFKNSRQCGRHQRLAKTNNIADENTAALIEVMSSNFHGSFLEFKKLIAKVLWNLELGQSSAGFLGQTIGNLEINMIWRNQIFTSPTGFNNLNQFVGNVYAPTICPPLLEPLCQFCASIVIKNINIQFSLL